MPLYRITAPNGQTYKIEGPPGASDADVADAVMAQYPESGKAPALPKESTFGSELVRGAKQLVSSARTGVGSVFNPEEAAKAGVARSEVIGQEAGVGPSLEAVQKAYQDKGVLSAAGEAVSQIPRALAGQGANLASMYAAGKAGAAAGAPFGARGRLVGGAAGAAGALLPQFMGSNVERQAAEQMDEGKEVNIDRTKAYTSAAGQAALESVGTAFTLGKRVVKGILGVVDDAALVTAKSQAELVKAAERSLAASAGRGVVRGAVEIPVEVSQQILERYQAGLDLTSPDAFKEYGESAYQAALIGGPLGGAAGAVGRGQARSQVEQQRRAEEAAKPREPKEEIVPGAKLPEEAPVGTQGTLFTPKEMGKRVPEPKEEPAPAKPAAVQQGEQATLGLDFQREYTDLFKERDRLREGPQTPEVKARVAELTGQLTSYDEADIGQRRAEKIIKEQQLTEEAEKKAADEAGAQRFPGLAGATTAPITQADIDAIGLPLKTSARWIQDNVLGKTVGEIKALVQRDPKLISGTGARAGVLKALVSPQPAAFKEKPNEPTTTKTDKPQGELDLGGGESGVGVSGKPTGTDVVQPGTGVPATTGTSATPDGLGLAPAGQPAGTGTTSQGTQPPAVIPQQPEARNNFAIERKSAYRSGTSEKVEWVLRRKSDNQIIGYYPTRKAAQQTYDIYTLPKEEVFTKYPELRPSATTTTPPATGAPATATTTTGPAKTTGAATKTTTTKETQAPATTGPAKTVNPFAALVKDTGDAETTVEEEAPKPAKTKSPFDISGPSTIGEKLQAESEDTKAGQAAARAVKAAEDAEKAAAEAKKTADKITKADEARKAEEAKKAADAKKAEETRKAEEERKTEEARKAEEAKQDAIARQWTNSIVIEPTWSEIYGSPQTPIVYEDADFAMYRALNKDDRIRFYVVNRKGQVATYPITLPNMQPSWLSGNDITRLVDAANKLHMKELDLAVSNRDGPFFSGKNIVGADAVNPAVVGYTENILQSLGLGNLRIFIFSKPDPTDSSYVDKHKLYGTQFARIAEIQKDTLNGSALHLGLDGKTYGIYLRPGMSESKQLEILAHELGHIVQVHLYDNASTAEQKAITNEYLAWRAKAKVATKRDFMYMLRNREDAESNIRRAELNGDADAAAATMQEFDSYWSSFGEWFADNVSRWATTNEKPLSIADKFFSRVAQMMRDLVAIVTSRKYPPAKSVADFLNKAGPPNFKPAPNIGLQENPQPNIGVTSDQTETPAFKNWFKDSKVVDKDGKPLRVYHGTLSTYDTFKVSPEGALGAGIYTTPSAEFAGTYADTSNLSRPNAPKDEVSGQQILPVYVSLQNPLILDNERGDPMIAALIKLGMAKDKAETLVEKAYDQNGYITKQVMTRAIAQGYDGIMQYKQGELSEVVAFKPTQLKSAIGNRGTFSTENPKIQFSISFSDEQLIDSMGPLDRNAKSGLPKLIAGVKANPDIGYVTKFRTQVTDIAATIEKRLREKFDGAVRNSLGELNPMGLYRQAQDYTKMLLEYFQTGTLYKDKTTGLWKSGMGEGVRPPAEVYALIDQYAEKNGYSRERATQIASRVLEGVRLDEMRRSNNTGMTNFDIHLKDNEIDQLVRAYNADPDLKEMSKLMDEARKAMVDNLVAVGRLSAEEGKLWREVVGYVPFDRETIDSVAANFNKAKKISGKGLAQLGKLPELVGSIELPVGNVFDNYLNTLGWMVGQTLKADATLITLRSLEDIGQAKKLRTGASPTANSVGAYVNGEMQYWELPSKYDVMAFKDLNPPKAGWIRAMGAFSNILRKTVTVLPPFALKQVMDDVQRAIMTSGVKNPGALVWMSLTNFPKLALAELRGIQHPIVKEYGRLGLTGEYDFEAGKPATSLLKDLGYKKRGVFETLIHRLDGITRASDLAVRKAIYDQTMNESKGDALLAQTRAREFINFRRRGANQFVTDMITVIPFFNAYIQGMDVLYRAASGKDSSSSVDRAQARRLFYSRAITVTMLSSLYALGKDEDDEDYKEMDLRTRDSNWILGGGYKIGVPGELGAIFKVVPERIVEYMKRQGTPEEQTAFDAMRTTLSYMFEQYLGRAVPIPQAIKPVIEAWANKSFLTGKDLEGYHHRAMDPSMRMTDQTSELAKAIAVFSRDEIGVEVSPIMIDNALRGYFGSTAAMTTMITDSLLNPTRVDRPLHKYALFSNYLYDPVGTRRMTEFYEEREKVGKANTTLNELMKTDLGRAEKYADEHSDELILEGIVNSTLEQLERTRAYRKYLNSPDGAADMSKDDRESSLKEIKQMELQYVNWVREAKTELRKVQ